MRVLSLLLACGLFLGGCSGSRGRPTPIPGDLTQLVNALVLRGATISDQVGGDPGCSVADLRNNAIRYEVRMPDEPQPSPVYVFNWYRPADFEAGEDPFARCVNEHRVANPGADVVSLASPPWRAYGPGWTPELRAAVEEALHVSGP